MKKIFLVVIILVIMFIPNWLLTNPIYVYYLSEFSIDEQGWKMELHSTFQTISLDSWFITTLTDTAYIKDGFSISPTSFLVITEENLKSDLQINSAGDIITLFNSDSYVTDELRFGFVNNPNISAPTSEYSICKDDSISFFYYFDKTPTFGYKNDTLNIKGFVEGYVKDSLGNPISNVTVIMDYFVDTVLTGSDGYFKFQNLARITLISYKSKNYTAPTDTIQILPDSTITINVQMIITGIEEIPFQQIKDYALSQNYPNPFNSSTAFYFSIPEESYIEINIYDEKGALVEKLFAGNKSPGQYKLNWETKNLASGIYIYELKTRNYSLSKKMILMK
ncbi:MAG: hypothetical protein STSR0008_11200 [Ignavibacterium sp.]